MGQKIRSTSALPKHSNFIVNNFLGIFYIILIGG